MIEEMAPKINEPKVAIIIIQTKTFVIFWNVDFFFFSILA